MNRALVFGIAIFFAVVGIALMGGETKVLAGHGCHGCNGCDGGCDGGCSGACDGCSGNDCCGCSGRQGLFAKMRAKRAARKCCGQQNSCCAPQPCCGHVAPPSCCGCAGAPVMEEAAPADLEAPAPEARLPRGFRAVSFRR